MGKGKSLKIYDTKAVFEDLDNSHEKILVSQEKDTGTRKYEKVKSIPSDLGNPSQIVSFEHIYGFYDLLSGSYAALVVESESFVSIPQMTIRKVKKILVLPLFRSGRILSELKQRDEDRYLELLNFSFKEHTLYYSTVSDITLTQQRIAKLALVKQTTEVPLWNRADLRFFWNRDLVQDLIVLQADDWIVPFMSAFIEVRTDVPVVDELKITLLFISRRSRYRQGCRFIKRGVDEHGNTGNFVETEQIVVFPDNKVTSYVQIRGSIPVKWSSPVHMRYEPVVFIEEASEQSQVLESTQKHIAELADKYSDQNNNISLLLINLIDNKKDQGRLGVAYKEAIDCIKPKVANCPLHFIWFDFHHECKQKGKWNNLAKLVIQVDDLFKAQKFFCKLPNGQVTSWQSGVIRTNCMDNLDRTNVVQSLFARRSLIYQLNKADSLDIMSVKYIMDTPWKAFEVAFKTVWTNNANAMSLGYAGTGALKVDFTKTGKRTFKGMIQDGMNSCMRYYINNFTDGVKQDGIDLMLGRYRPSPSEPSPFSTRTSQAALSNNLTKIFVILMIVFSAFLIFLPPSLPYTSFVSASEETGQLERNLRHLQSHFTISLLVTMAIAGYFTFKVVKKGSKIGEKMVIHPQFCPEPLPPARA